MYISRKKLKYLCRKNGLTLCSLLSRARVSKTAFYSLVRKDDILPKTINAIAKALGARPSAFLEEESPEEKKIADLIKRTSIILNDHPQLDKDNVWHTLLLLDKKPVERMRMGLIRGQKFDLHRKGSRVS